MRKPLPRLKRFAHDIFAHTPFATSVAVLVVLWLTFTAAVFFAERESAGSSVRTYGDALYWGIAAFSTAGIADAPVTEPGKFIGGVWIVVGSVIFFGSIVGTVTAYFMRPLQRPHRMIIDTIEYNLEQLDDLSLEEIDLLKDTVDGLIDHVEELKARQSKPKPAK